MTSQGFTSDLIDAESEHGSRMYALTSDIATTDVSPTNLVSSALINGEEWVSHFTTLLSHEIQLPDKEHAPHTEPGWENFTEGKVRSAILAKENRKLSGADDIYYEYCKQRIDHAVGKLSALFNACLERGHIPNQQWRRIYLHPVYRSKGNATDPANYRGIALTSVVRKAFTSIIVT